MQRIRLAASILVFLMVVAVFGYLFFQPIHGKQKVRREIMLAVRDASVAAPDTSPKEFEAEVRMFNLLPDVADVIVEYRDRTTREKKFFRYSVRYQGGRWVVATREPFVPPNRQ